MIKFRIMFIIVFAVIPEIEWKKKECKQQIGRLREGPCLQIIREQINVRVRYNTRKWDLGEQWMRSSQVVRTSDCQCLSRNSPEPVFLNVYGAPELIPRNEFRQPGGPVR